MLSQRDSGTVRWFGLAPEVLYRIELGLAVVDDGDRLFKVERGFFEKVIAPEPVHDISADPDLARIAAALEATPSVFRRFESKEQALASIQDKEV